MNPSVLCLVAQSSLTATVARQAPLSMGILQARILAWVAMPSLCFSTTAGQT